MAASSSSSSSLAAGALSLAALRPSLFHWSVLVRIVDKSPLRAFKTGDGVFFTALLIDAEGGMMKATAFGEVAQRLHLLLTDGGAYLISNATIKVAKPASMASSQAFALGGAYEMNLRWDTRLTPVVGETGLPLGPVSRSQPALAPPPPVADAPLMAIADLVVGTRATVRGVVTAFGSVEDIRPKADGSMLRKRELLLTDEAGAVITLTLWGDVADGFTHAVPVSVVARNCTVKKFMGALGISTNLIEVDAQAAPAAAAAAASGKKRKREPEPESEPEVEPESEPEPVSGDDSVYEPSPPPPKSKKPRRG